MSGERAKAAVKVDRGGRWTRVYAESGGRDVSHLVYARFPFQAGRGVVNMAGVGGVATEPEHRRQGLSGKVFARAMAAIKADGYSCSGLYTATSIVAHRLYRRFGFVDLLQHRPAYKLLDPEAFAIGVLGGRLEQDRELNLSMTLELRPHRPLHLRVSAGRVAVPKRKPRRVDLTLHMAGETLIALAREIVSFDEALTSKLVEWEGDEGLFERLAARLRRRESVVYGG